MKKLSVLFLSLALVSILAGCFHNASEEVTTEETPAAVEATVEATAETPAQ